MTTMRVLRVVPCNQQIFDAFVKAHLARGIWSPPLHAEGIFVLDETGMFVAGVQLFSAGPYLLAEDLATEPMMPLRLRHSAVALIATHAAGYAIASCKTLRMTVRSKGLRMMLKRLGFKTQAALPMFFLPAELRYPQKRTPRGHDSAGRSWDQQRSNTVNPSATKLMQETETVKPRQRRKAVRANGPQERKAT